MSENISSQQNLENLATKRNSLALQRTLLANERTFSAWMRTGLASVVAGLGIAHLLCLSAGERANCFLGAIFVVAGTIVYGVAFWRYWHGQHHLKMEDADVTPIWIVGLLTLLFILGGIIALSFLLLG